MALSREFFMPFVPFFAILGLCVCGSLLLRGFYLREPEEWKASGEPIGGWWAPKGKRGELILGVASSSLRAGFRYHWYLVFQTPEWIKKAGREQLRILQWGCRVCTVVAGFGIIRIFLGFR